MHHERSARLSVARAVTLLLALLLILSACRALPTGLMAPAAEASPSPSPTVIAKSMCEAAADLRVDVDFLRSMELREDGLLSAIVAADAALGEARTLSALVAEEYQPYVADLVLSLEGLRRTIEGLGEQETLGAEMVTIGQAITDIGSAMDALALELRDPCPENS